MADVQKVGMTEERAGETSMARMILLGSAVAVLGVFCIDNIAAIVACFARGKDIDMVDIPVGALGIFTAAVAGKAVQKFAEKGE